MNRMDKWYEIAQTYFRGKIRAAEELQLSRWLNESEANRTQFRQWENEWREQARSQSSANTQALWKKLKAEANIPDAQIVRPLRTRRMWYYTAAAVLLLLIGSALLWLSRPVSNESTPYSTFTARTEAHEMQTVTLADGTEVVLNAQSALTCADDFNDTDRRVSFEGEAFFRVSKDAERPFIIHVGDYEVTVLGTEFNLCAYPKDMYYTLSLLSGSVRITYPYDTVYVQPNEQVRFNLLTQNFHKIPYPAENAVAWKNNRLEGEMPLGDLVARLERIYDVRIQVENAVLADEIVYISISSDESFEDVCDALEVLLGIRIIPNETGYAISAL